MTFSVRSMEFSSSLIAFHQSRVVFNSKVHNIFGLYFKDHNCIYLSSNSKAVKYSSNDFDFVLLRLEGDSWIDLNLQPCTVNTITGRCPYHLQQKIQPGLRSDTGKPNKSPYILYKPVYKSVRLMIDNNNNKDNKNNDDNNDYDETTIHCYYCCCRYYC